MTLLPFFLVYYEYNDLHRLFYLYIFSSRPNKIHRPSRGLAREHVPCGTMHAMVCAPGPGLYFKSVWASRPWRRPSRHPRGRVFHEQPKHEQEPGDLPGTDIAASGHHEPGETNRHFLRPCRCEPPRRRAPVESGSSSATLYSRARLRRAAWWSRMAAMRASTGGCEYERKTCSGCGVRFARFSRESFLSAPTSASASPYVSTE